MGGIANRLDQTIETLSNLKDQMYAKTRENKPIKDDNTEYEYVLAYKNHSTGMVHPGTITFDSEDEGENHCHELNMKASDIVMGLGSYILIKREKKN